MSVANAEDQPNSQSGPSLVIQAVVVLVLTILSISGGLFAGMYLKNGAPAETAQAKVLVEPMAPEEGAGHEAELDGDPDEEGIQLVPRMVPLEPVTTNLAAPSDIWVRMELSVVFSAPPSADLVRTIHQDLLAYMRTVTLQQVEGASGFQHLKADLEERARLRSDGLATQLMIRTLLFE